MSISIQKERMMDSKIRLVKINELDFLTCVKYKMFGRNTDFIKSWKKGDLIVFVVGDYIAGVAEILDKMFFNSKRLWLKEDNSFRVPVAFTHVFDNDRPYFLDHKEELEASYGKYWGNVFVLRKDLPANVIVSIINNINSYPSKREEVVSDIDARIFDYIELEKQLVVKEYDKMQNKHKDVSEEMVSDEEKTKILVSKMLSFTRGDIERFEKLRVHSFVTALDDVEKDYLDDIGYDNIKEECLEIFKEQGFLRDSFVEYGTGDYLIIGDSHGDHTAFSMINLINQIKRSLNIDKVFHIGHILDDNNVINRGLNSIDDLTVVSRIEEAGVIEKFKKENKSKFDIVREAVIVGGVLVANQDMQTDYMAIKPTSASIRKSIYKGSYILSHHLHEFDVATSDDESRILEGYPGCICENHLESKIRNCLDKEGNIDLSKSPWNTRFQRRKEKIKNDWEQGVFILHVDDKGSNTFVPCRIKSAQINNRNQYAISYFDKIICEDGVLAPDLKTLINTDLHVPLFDSKVLHIQEQIASDYKPDIFITMGDIRDSEGINHHKIQKGHVVTNTLIDEGASVYHVLKRMSKWADEKYIIFGNHERFARDFIERYPQFSGLLEFEFLSGFDQLGYSLIDLQKKLEIEDVVYVHGDLLRGRSSNPLDSLSGMFPYKTVVCGHVHYASVRKGCYSMPQTGMRDQKYNEKTITRWCHGFGLCNTISGISFVTPIVVENNKVILNNKKYSSEQENFCKEFNYSVEINYTEIV